MRTFRIIILAVSSLDVKAHAQIADLKPAIQRFDPFVWKSETPEYSLFIQSKELTEIRFLAIKSGYRYGDTWYTTFPVWIFGQSGSALDSQLQRAKK